MGRKSKKLSREEQEEVEEWIYQNNTEETRMTDTMTIRVKCKTENQKILVNAIKEKEVVICSGPAGTGKTFLACAEALKLIKRNGKYKKIVIVKSVTTLKNEEIGFLKGNLREKMEPFMFSFVHNFEKIVGQSITSRLRELKTIEELPIAYMRGINLDRSIIIIDEAQNISQENIRTIMTRLGKDSKMIFLGDERQQDSKGGNGLTFLMDHFTDIEEIGCVQFTKSDVVRNPLIAKIERVFESLQKNIK
jgi:phosphate starvation-inducible PhoH-like protein|tara:strand:+ start:611 stop:1357 length:747 start_codon:yes stop_codon:yes gene_type:complete